MSIQFLDLSDVLDIHMNQIENYGGTLGVRDVELLKSAIAMPQATYGDEYLHTDIFEMAAAYLFHLTQNHPFLDGNKRVGVATALVFLIINDFECQADEDELYQLVIGVASGEVFKSEIAIFFRNNSNPL